MLIGISSIGLGPWLARVGFDRLGRLDRGVLCGARGAVQLLRFLVARRSIAGRSGAGWLRGNGVQVAGAARMMLLRWSQRADGLVLRRIGLDGDETWSQSR